MRKSLILMVATIGVALLATGCAGPEKKFGRGMANVGELVRWGETRRSIEQTSVFYSPVQGSTWGFVKGFNRSLARVGVGVYEMVTFPIPSYDPLFTDYLTPEPAEPASYYPNLVAGPTFDTNDGLGFTGGTLAPFIPGNQFHIYDQPH